MQRDRRRFGHVFIRITYIVCLFEQIWSLLKYEKHNFNRNIIFHTFTEKKIVAESLDSCIAVEKTENYGHMAVTWE